MCPEKPLSLLDQLAPGGLLLVPIGGRACVYDSYLIGGDLYAFRKLEDGSIQEFNLFSCSFVPAMG
jgi:protein-L-isoaspartate O-methyltransferase